MPSDWLSWEFWAKDSQSLNHLALIIAGVIGIPLLAIRMFAANKSAKATVVQARTADQGTLPIASPPPSSSSAATTWPFVSALYTHWSAFPETVGEAIGRLWRR